MHGSTVMTFPRQVMMLNDSGQIGRRSEVLGLRHKMSETWSGLIMDFAANLRNFSTPNHTHNFDNHNNGYGRSRWRSC
jgi:hypothetical protein